jgi:hypothetical protein
LAGVSTILTRLQKGETAVKTTRLLGISLIALLLWAATAPARDPAGALVEMVRDATDRFRATVEYVVLAKDWDAKHPTTTPSLLGHLFHYVGSPNRYGLPAFYELHVWAWKQNPRGMFADWNPRVSCAGYSPDATAPVSAGAHGAGH